MKKFALALSALMILNLVPASFAEEAENIEVTEVKEAPVADPAISAALTRQEIKFEVDEDGDYRIIVPVDDENRTQLVFVNSNLEKYGDKLKIREIWSVGYRNENGVPAALVKKAAALSSDYILGAWELASENLLVMVSKVPSNLDDDALVNTIYSIARRADAFEKDTLGTDDL